MNKILSTSFALTLLFSTSVSAATLPRTTDSIQNDTTLTYRGRRIVVTDDGHNVSVTVNDAKGRSLSQIYVSSSDSTRKEETWQVENDFTFSDLLPRNWSAKITNHRSFSAHSDYFYMGFNNAIGGNVDNAMTRSSEIGFNVISNEHAHGSGHGISYGLSFNWRTYRIDDGRFFNWDDRSKKLSVAEQSDTIDVSMSRLRTFRFMIPVDYEWQDFGGKPFFVKVGIALEITPTARVKNSCHVDGHSKTFKENHLRHNILGGSACVSAGYKDWGLYVRYVPTPLFSSKHGPDFTSLTFGISYYL